MKTGNVQKETDGFQFVALSLKFFISKLLNLLTASLSALLWKKMTKKVVSAITKTAPPTETPMRKRCSRFGLDYKK